jgi:hypothetical protein
MEPVNKYEPVNANAATCANHQLTPARRRAGLSVTPPPRP